MAYNNQKGTQHTGDIQFEGDPNDTQIDFENDFVAIKTNNQQRFIVSGSAITASVNFVPSGNETLDLGSADLNWRNIYAQEFFGDLEGAIRFDAKNDEGDTITKGQVVYIKGVQGQTPTVGLAACDDPNKMPAFGLAASTVADGAALQIVTMGSINNLNLTSLYGKTFSEGDTVYVETGSGGTSGSLTNVTPTGSDNLLQNMGMIIRNGGGGDGQIKVGGAGRSNATPNLDKGYLFVGNDSDRSVQDNTIYVSSSANRVGINTVPLDSTLEVGGTVAVSGNVNIRQNANFFQGYSTTNSNVSLIGVNGSDVVQIGNLGFNISMQDDVDVNGELSASLGVTGSSLNTLNTAINSTHLSSSLNISGAAFYANGVELTPGGGSPGGANTEIQFNADGAFGASGALSFLTSSNVLSGSGRATFEKVSIGEDTSTTPLYVKALDDELVSIFKSATHDVILAVTGSRKVVVGGVHLDGVLNVSGAAGEKLISLKNDNKSPAFYVSNNETYVSGTVQIKNVAPRTEFSSSVDADGRASIGLNTSNNILIQNDSTNKHIVLKANDNGILREGFRIDGSVPEVVVNQGSDSLIDFRVESDNSANMLYVKGSTDKVGINTSAPTETLAVSGSTSISGSLTVTGSVRGHIIDYSTHGFLNSGGSPFEGFIPFYDLTENTNADYRHQMIAPFAGNLRKVLFRSSNSQTGGPSSLTLYRGVDGNDAIDNGVIVEIVSLTGSAASTTTTFNFTGSGHYGPGDVIGIEYNMHNTLGRVNVTCVWEFEQE